MFLISSQDLEISTVNTACFYGGFSSPLTHHFSDAFCYINRLLWVSFSAQQKQYLVIFIESHSLLLVENVGSYATNATTLLLVISNMLMTQLRAQQNNVKVIYNLPRKNEMSANFTKWQMILLFEYMDYKSICWFQVRIKREKSKALKRINMVVILCSFSEENTEILLDIFNWWIILFCS